MQEIDVWNKKDFYLLKQIVSRGNQLQMLVFYFIILARSGKSILKNQSDFSRKGSSSCLYIAF